MDTGVQTTIVVLAMGAFITAAYVDVRRRRIPNAISYMIGSLGLLRILLAADPTSAGWTLAAAAGVLVIAFMFFWGGTFGGGDAKLLTGAVLLIGYHDIFPFMFLMSSVRRSIGACYPDWRPAHSEAPPRKATCGVTRRDR